MVIVSKRELDRDTIEALRFANLAGKPLVVDGTEFDVYEVETPCVLVLDGYATLLRQVTPSFFSASRDRGFEAGVKSLATSLKEVVASLRCRNDRGEWVTENGEAMPLQPQSEAELIDLVAARALTTADLLPETNGQWTRKAATNG